MEFYDFRPGSINEYHQNKKPPKRNFDVGSCFFGAVVTAVLSAAVGIALWQTLQLGFCNIDVDGQILYDGSRDASGQRSGYGIEFYPNSSLAFVGTWSAGLRDGQGVEFFPDGSIKFHGTWKDGQRSGIGQLFGENGTLIYTGQFEGGVMNGEGADFQNNSVFYMGQFSNGSRYGHGVAIYGENLTHYYVGEFKNNFQDGSGKTYSTGYTYEGQFKVNKMDGFGLLVFEDGSHYKGQFRENQFEGVGCYFSAGTGDVYVGAYSQHHKNGQGTYFRKNGERFDCTWNLGKRNGKCKLFRNGEVCQEVYVNGDKRVEEESCFQNNKPVPKIYTNCYNFTQ